MVVKNLVVVLTFLALAAIASSFAEDAPRERSVTGQQNAAASQVVINEVNLDRFPTVQLFATVLKNGTPLKGLTAGDFKVQEDGTDQSPLTVEQKLPPLSIIVLIDRSGSMKPRMKETKATATAFLSNLGSSDSTEVITFSRQVRPLTPMSTNRETTRRAIDSIRAHGDTALYDALWESVGVMKTRPGTFEGDEKKATVDLKPAFQNQTEVTIRIEPER